FDRARLTELQTVSRLSGGVERLDLSKIWEAPRRSEFRDMRPWLLVAFLVVFLADALLTRLGGRLPKFERVKISPRAKGRTSEKSKASTAVPNVAVTRGEPAEPIKSSIGKPNRKSRFDRAKRGL